MRALRHIAMGLSVVGLAFLVPALSFADQEHAKGDHTAMIKVVNDAAAALKVSNPDLSAGLTSYADRESKEMAEKNEGKEAKEMTEDAGTTIKLFRDSATALSQSHPDLAAELNKKADKKEKWLAEKKEGKKEEAGEKREPKSEQAEHMKK